MKQTDSKEAWRRRLREMQFQDVLAAGMPVAPSPPLAIHKAVPNSRAPAAGKKPRTATPRGPVPLMAPEGKCASCDRRRMLLRAAKKRAREKD